MSVNAPNDATANRTRSHIFGAGTSQRITNSRRSPCTPDGVHNACQPARPLKSQVVLQADKLSQGRSE